MSNLTPPMVPRPDDESDGVPTRDVDGEPVLDTDVDPALVDSADADRAAAATGEPDDETV